jgi:hypothetical protein
VQNCPVICAGCTFPSVSYHRNSCNICLSIRNSCFPPLLGINDVVLSGLFYHRNKLIEIFQQAFALATGKKFWILSLKQAILQVKHTLTKLEFALLSFLLFVLFSFTFYILGCLKSLVCCCSFSLNNACSSAWTSWTAADFFKQSLVLCSRKQNNLTYFFTKRV